MSNRPNTRWGARQPPRRGGGGGGSSSGGASGGYEQSYDEYNYGHQQYSASGYEYDPYDQSQPNYDRGSASSKRYSSNRNNYDAGNYHYNPPPRHAKGNFAETNNQNQNQNHNNKPNASVTKKPAKKQDSEPSSPLPTKEAEPTVETPPVSTKPNVEPPAVTSPTEASKPVETPAEAEPLPPTPEPPPEENFDLIRLQITSYLTERHDRLKQRQELREQNIQAEKTRLNAEQQQAAMTRLDSSIKRIPPFIKRLRTLTEQQRDSLCRDMQALNLTRYISELATALTEAKLKMSDVWTSVQMCSLLHQRYPDFSMSLLENWLKVLHKETLTDNLSKVRVDLRLYAELITVHVLPLQQSINHLLTLLNALTNNDKDFSNLTVLISFCRLCGEDYADIFSSKIHKLNDKLEDKIEETNKSGFHPAELRQQIRQMLNDYFQKLAVYVVDEHKQLQKQDQLLRRTMENRGEINQEIKDRYEQAHTTFQKLLQNTETMADLLEQTMPELPVEEASKKNSDRTGIDFYLPGRPDDDLGGNTLWEDSEAKQFYEEIPDLKLFLPNYAYREPPSVTPAATPEETDTLDPVQMEQEIEKEALEVTSTTAEAEEEDTTLADIEDGPEEDVGANNIKLMMDVFVTQLPTCVNREMIDKAARDFATNLNTKQNRKRLIKALYTVQRTYLHLLPFYSRLIAQLFPIMPEIGNEMVRLLKNEFRAHIKRKDQIYIESKIKTVRFIGELVKFSVFPKTEAINCLKTLLSDFRHHNIEMCCNLLETCGRFLYRSPDCHRRAEIILEILMRKKAVLNLDNRYTTQIENAYYYCNPPETREIEKKIRSPIQEYLRRLLFKDLNKINVEKVLRQVRKFNWYDAEFHTYAAKCLAAPQNMKFNSIQCLASILSGLSHFYDDVAIEVLDNVLDDVRSGLELNIPKFNQRRLCMIKYLGEMYNYRVVDSIIIFRTLYLLITYGVNLDNSEPNDVDPPEHLFRIRLVCTLLDTCGQYFDRGTGKKRLDCFLVYFQRYYYFKREQPIWNAMTYPFPREIEHIVDECIVDLRPKFNKATSYAKACEQVENMEKEYIGLINEQQMRAASKEMVHSARDMNLAPITEDEEQATGYANDDDRPNRQRQGDDEDDEERDENNEEEEEEDDDDEGHGTTRVRRTRPSGGSAERTSGGSGADEECLDTDENDASGFEDDNQGHRRTSTERTKVVSEEDTEFMKAFDALVAESVAQRTSDMTKIAAPDIPVPVHLRKNKLPSAATTLMSMSHSDGDDESENTAKTPETVNFVVMLKKNNKPQFYDMAVSSTSEMAIRLKAREQADREEKARLKILTLNMSTRMEQQETEQELMMNVTNRTGPTAASNLNREKKLKYVPPKGAPDADLIFGSKKR